MKNKGAYTSGSVAENSGSAWQGVKISASANILAPTELHQAYTLGSVAENSTSAWQGAKISASADILALTELYLVHNSINTTSG